MRFITFNRRKRSPCCETPHKPASRSPFLNIRSEARSSSSLPSVSLHFSSRWLRLLSGHFAGRGFSSPTYCRDGKLGVGDWLRSYRGVEEAAWFARDDLAPFIMMGWHSFKWGFERITKKIGNKRSVLPVAEQPGTSTALVASLSQTSAKDLVQNL